MMIEIVTEEINETIINNNVIYLKKNKINIYIKIIIAILFLLNQSLLIPFICMFITLNEILYINVFISVMYLFTYLYGISLLVFNCFSCDININNHNYHDRKVKLIFLFLFYLLELLYIAINIIAMSNVNIYHELSKNKLYSDFFMIIMILYAFRYLTIVFIMIYNCIKSAILHQNKNENENIIFKKKKTNNNFVICCICLERNNHKSKELLNCNHIYHKKCIIEWQKINNKCPMCKVNIM